MYAAHARWRRKSEKHGEERRGEIEKRENGRHVAVVL